jgi:predicted nucleic acid-binding Zn ribbon protein
MKPERRTPTRVSAPLARLLQRIDPEHRLHVYSLWTFWEEEVGTAIAARARPGGFHAGILSVQVKGHTWMQELQFLKETLRERLNARLGKELIRDIYFTSVAASEPRRPANRPESRPVAPPPVPVALPPIRDERLAAVFERIVRAHARRCAAGDPGAKPR